MHWTWFTIFVPVLQPVQMVMVCSMAASLNIHSDVLNPLGNQNIMLHVLVIVWLQVQYDNNGTA